MTDPEVSLVERLSEAENPRELHDWEGRDGYYLAACRVSAEDIPGLIDLGRKWRDPDWPDGADLPQIDLEKLDLLPITAWRTLADLKADAAVQPLLDMLCDLDDEFDDWVSEELPHVFGKIGEPAIEPLTQLAKNDGKPDYIRSIAARGLGCVARYHADTRDHIVACLVEMMASAEDDHLDFNSALLVELVELRAVEAAEPIERAFAGNLLDVGMMGNWEEVRQELGVEGLGLKMPENPFNSLANIQSQFPAEPLQTRLGIGVFSDSPIFALGEIDDNAQQAYYQRANSEFSQSLEARQFVERHGDLGWSHMLLDFGINYPGEIVDTMGLGSVKKFVFDFVPRKVSTDADAAESIILELTAFWQYLDRVYKLPAARSIIDWLKSDGLVARLQADMSDPANFGMAKSILNLGQQAGYDMTSEAELAQFIAAYNQSLPSVQPASGTPITRKPRIGRNSPCPCGSGRKFKKCCGG